METSPISSTSISPFTTNSIYTTIAKLTTSSIISPITTPNLPTTTNPAVCEAAGMRYDSLRNLQAIGYSSIFSIINNQIENIGSSIFIGSRGYTPSILESEVSIYFILDETDFSIVNIKYNTLR